MLGDAQRLGHAELVTHADHSSDFNLACPRSSSVDSRLPVAACTATRLLSVLPASSAFSPPRSVGSGQVRRTPRPRFSLASSSSLRTSPMPWVQRQAATPRRSTSTVGTWRDLRHRARRRAADGHQARVSRAVAHVALACHGACGRSSGEGGSMAQSARRTFHPPLPSSDATQEAPPTPLQAHALPAIQVVRRGA